MFQILSGQKIGEKRALLLAGQKVCQRSFRLLIGIGKNRMQKLRSALKNKEAECPVDQRFMPQKYERLPQNSTRPIVVEYLQRLYHTVAEPLPEAFSLEKDPGERLPKSSVRRRGKRPRHLFKCDKADEQKKFKGHVDAAKFLPPGTILEYLEILRSEVPSVYIGRKTFCRAAWLSLLIQGMAYLKFWQANNKSMGYVSNGKFSSCQSCFKSLGKMLHFDDFVVSVFFFWCSVLVH